MATVRGIPTPPISPVVGQGGLLNRDWLIFVNDLVQFIANRNLYGTAADRPAATAVYPGTVYFETDTLLTFISTGNAWAPYAQAGVVVDPTGALDGDGTVADPLAVKVDGSTVVINGSNELEATGLAGVSVDPAGALDGDGTPGDPLAVRVDGASIQINASNNLEGALIRRRVVMTNAQILALPTTTFHELVPAPGAGKIIVPVAVHFRANVVGAYTNIHADAYLSPHLEPWSIDNFSYLTNGNATGLTQVTDWLGTAGVHLGWRPLPYAFGGGAPGTSFTTDWGLVQGLLDVAASENQPFILYCDNAGAGDFTGGNAANEIVAETLYYVADV